MRPFDDITLNRALYLIEHEKTLRMRELEMKRRQFLHNRLNKRPHTNDTEVTSNQRREELRRRIQREMVAEAQNQASLLQRKTELFNALKKRKSALEPKPFVDNSLAAKCDEVGEVEESLRQVNSAHEWPEYKLSDQNRAMNLYQKGFEILKRKKEANRNTFVESVNSILHKLREKEENPKDPVSSLSKSILKNFVDDDFVKTSRHNVQDDEAPQNTASENVETPPLLQDGSMSVESNEGDSNMQPKPKIDDGKEKNEKQIFQHSPGALDLWATVSKRQMEIRGLANKNQGTRIGSLNCNPKFVRHRKSGANHAGKDSGKEELSHAGYKNGEDGVNHDDEKRRKEGGSYDGFKSRKESVSHNDLKSNNDGINRDSNKREKDEVSHDANKIGKEGMTYDGNNSVEKGVSLDGIESIEEGMGLVGKKNGIESLNQEGKNKRSEHLYPLTAKKRNSSLSPRKSITNRINAKDCQHSQESLTPKQESPRGQDTAKPESLSPNSSPRKAIPCKTKGRTAPKLSINNRASLTDNCIEECDETVTPNTLVVIHDESNIVRPSIQWDEGFRYSFSPQSNEENSGKCCETSAYTPETDTPPMTANTDGSGSLSLLDLHVISKDNEHPAFPGDPISQRSHVLGSPFSMNTASDIRTNDRPLSRQSEGGKRRLSMQTRGALRALFGVMKEDNGRLQQLQDEHFQPESTSYKTIIEALSGAAADADVHTQRLEKIRQAGLGLQSADRGLSLTKSSVPITERNDKSSSRNLRRNTIEAPGRSTCADVTDPVYKFLQRRSQSKTIRRHKTLSNVELKLLAHAPGEDITGRRHSFSSQQSSRRSSRNVMSGSILERMSASSRSRKISADASALLENEWEHSQKDSTKEDSETTRPTSVAMSELSFSDIASFQGKLKDSRSYSWAPDVSETKEWHVLAMELLARREKGVSKFRTVSHMLQWLGEEYRRQTAAMLYEELRYCSYLRLPKHQQPPELAEWDVDTVFAPESPTPQKP